MANRKDDKDSTERAEDAAARATTHGATEAVKFGRQQADRVRELLGDSARSMSDGPVDVDAVITSSARIARSMQDMGWEMVQFTQNSMRRSLRTANDLMACRSVDDMVQLQQDYMRESVDTFLRESARLMEMSNTMASDALEPINHRQDGHG